MRVLAFDAYVAEERFRELGVERAATSDELYAEADFITVHLPEDARDRELARRRGLREDEGRRAGAQRGARPAAGGRRTCKAALDSGKVAGAALDVFREEPVTDHPLFGYPNVIVTPHLGASTAEATDRAGYQAAEQVVAALTGGVVTSAVNVPAVAAEDLEALGPFLPLALGLGRIAVALAEGTSVDAHRGRVPAAGSPSATPACSPSRCSRACWPGTPRRT